MSYENEDELFGFYDGECQVHMAFLLPSSKNYVAESWRNTVKNLSLSPQKRKRRKRKNGAVKSDNLSPQLNFAPQQAKVAELFVIKPLSKRLCLRKINTTKS